MCVSLECEWLFILNRNRRRKVIQWEKFENANKLNSYPSNRDQDSKQTTLYSLKFKKSIMRIQISFGRWLSKQEFFFLLFFLNIKNNVTIFMVLKSGFSKWIAKFYRKLFYNLRK